MCMCPCVPVCAHVCSCVLMCAHVWPCVLVSLALCAFAHVCPCVPMCARVCPCVAWPCVCMCACVSQSKVGPICGLDVLSKEFTGQPKDMDLPAPNLAESIRFSTALKVPRCLLHAQCARSPMLLHLATSFAVLVAPPPPSPLRHCAPMYCALVGCGIVLMMTVQRGPLYTHAASPQAPHSACVVWSCSSLLSGVGRGLQGSGGKGGSGEFALTTRLVDSHAVPHARVTLVQARVALITRAAVSRVTLSHTRRSSNTHKSGFHVTYPLPNYL
jgi:hypothetical protein